MENIEHLNKLINDSKILANVKDEDIEYIPKVNDIVTRIEDNQVYKITNIIDGKHLGYDKLIILNDSGFKKYSFSYFLEKYREATGSEEIRYHLD